MLGIPDPWIWMAYLLCLAAALLCLAYGAATWNAGVDEPVEKEDEQWAQHEDEIKDKL